MIGIRRAEDRGHYDSGNIASFHSFSFGDYQDPAHQGFGPLRVINEDCVRPGNGFPDHPHEETEILSYVAEGKLEYRDHDGNAYLLEAGDAQVASCGTGIVHSVYNACPESTLRVLQFWIQPERGGLPPTLHHWDDPDFARRRGRWALVASRGGRDGSMPIRRDVDVHAARLEAGDALEYRIHPGRHLWLQIPGGTATLNGEHHVVAGDGVAVNDESRIELTTETACDVLLFDLA